MTTRLVLGASAWVLLAACPAEGDPGGTYQASVTLSLPLAGTDVSGGELDERRAVGALAGAPWAGFVAAATDSLGVAPATIDVLAAELAMTPASAATIGLGGIFTGDAVFGFAPSGSSPATVASCDVVASDGEGPLPCDLAWTGGAAANAIVAGQFDVSIVGLAALSFPSVGPISIDLVLELSAAD